MSSIRALSLIAFASTAAFGQQPPPVLMVHPEAVVHHEFTKISDIYELRDARVVVSDQLDQSVVTANFLTGEVVPVGRKGAGPGEYGTPREIFPLGGDSAGLMDETHRRLLVIRPDGTLGGIVDPKGQVSERPLVRLKPLRATDALGRFYARGQPITIENGGMHVTDSSAIERWAPDENHRDTIAWVQVNMPDDAVALGGMVAFRSGGVIPFTGFNDWAVASDGRIAIVHDDPYSIDFITATGARTDGAAISIPRLKVSEGHKEQWRHEQQRPVRTVMFSREGGVVSSGLSRMPVEEPKEWPEDMPPFLAGALTFDQNGLLWIRRTTPAGDPPSYDVIDGNGRRVAEVKLAARARIVGFGKGSVYVALPDENDVEQLQRYTIPSFAPR